MCTFTSRAATCTGCFSGSIGSSSLGRRTETTPVGSSVSYSSSWSHARDSAFWICIMYQGRITLWVTTLGRDRGCGLRWSSLLWHKGCRLKTIAIKLLWLITFHCGWEPRPTAEGTRRGSFRRAGGFCRLWRMSDSIQGLLQLGSRWVSFSYSENLYAD